MKRKDQLETAKCALALQANDPREGAKPEGHPDDQNSGGTGIARDYLSFDPT